MCRPNVLAQRQIRITVRVPGTRRVKMNRDHRSTSAGAVECRGTGRVAGKCPPRSVRPGDASGRATER
jgi:hypothetical protein